ncbi:glycerophosphodiester phosphodiesterase family protein [Hyphobacterium sp. HN65]|uniref:glycerophosphodiester phosphodiesterase n=1 Tax=Hyphobacterium lacteum TaxID=3116575 RepID=A0ABU7LTS5_9PROT|nr:glycerophosphodiester phosphodiesterase family protein [Hyphobacterium sp. HN65]MEE2527293.1 glycerophosphodiester phosphodiesterase family protein [Hyphobacterium sp. HN65]
MKRWLVMIGLGLAACSASPQGNWNTLSGEAPLVIAHRGASGELPEHTLEAYTLAMEQGADVIEPDLVVTSDGVLVARHDAYLSTTTDVASHTEFAARRREMFGRDDWWVFDFTAEELRSLRAVQPQEGRDPSYDGQFLIPTFEEILTLVNQFEAECGCVIGIEPEVKHPAEFAAANLDPLPLLNQALLDHGLYAEDAPVVIQSFDAGFLVRMNAVAPVRLAMLYSSPDEEDGNMSGYTLEAVAQFADGLGANKALLLNPDGTSTGLLEQAHALGLEVHVWTVRDDREPLVGETVEDELRALYALGVDAVFTDFPVTALRVRDEM